MRYFLFRAASSIVGPNDCTTDMPSGCYCSIPASGVYENKHTNVMDIEGELGSWTSINSSKINELDIEQRNTWIANLTPKQPLTKLEFRSRFTFEELVSIEIAAETDATIRVLNQNQAVAEFIDITDARTIAGINLLVSKTLLTQERADVILAS